MLSKPLSRPSLLQRFVESNPFYLISACCMLGGCLALTNSLSWLSIPGFNLLILIGTLNLYEAALIGLAAFLVLRRGLRRDGMMLVILEAFFLIDVTFLNAEIATRKLPYGTFITALCFVAAIVKLAAVLRIMGVRRWSAGSVFVLVQVAAILALPLIFSGNTGGVISPLEFYIAWWVVGLMPVAYELLVKLLPADETAVSRSPALAAYMLLSWAALVAHVGVLHYVYDVSFYPAMVAPPLLAIAMALNRTGSTSVASRMNIVTIQILIPLAAVLLSVGCPSELTISLDHAGHFTFTTLLLAIAASYMEYTYLFFRRYYGYAAFAGVGLFLAFTFGPTLDQVDHSIRVFWNQIGQWGSKVMPQTAVGWGTLFVVAAFAFLGLGAGVSLRRSAPPAVDPTVVD